MSSPVQIANSELLSTALRTAYAARTAILEIYGHPLEVELKQDRSPLTAADRASHQILADQLAATGLPLLSEEGTLPCVQERQAWPAYWLIDPLDGTKEFIHRNGDFTVNIALIENHVPTLGVVYVPVQDECYFGLCGMGAGLIAAQSRFESLESDELPTTLEWSWVHRFVAALATEWPGFSPQGIACRALRPRPTRTGPLRVVASRSHAGGETEAFIARLRQMGYDVQCTSRGSALKLCLVASGEAHVYPRLGPTMEWDTAAAQAIVECAGGRVVLYDNEAQHAFESGGLVSLSQSESLRYNREDLRNPAFIVLHPAIQKP